MCWLSVPRRNVGVRVASSRLLIVAVWAAVQVLLAPASWAEDGDYQQVTAKFQQQDATGAGHSVVVDGRTVNAAALLIRLNDQSTVAAYSLDPNRPPSTAGTWNAVDPDTPGLRGVASASWLASKSASVGAPLKSEVLERAATQIAIWVKAGALEMSPATVPSPQLRSRASELVAAAPDTYDVQRQVTRTQIAVGIKRPDIDTVTIEVNLSNGREDTFDNSQKIDLRVSGRWCVVRTARRTDVHQEQLGEALPCADSGPAPDNNTALVRLDRTDDATSLEFHWGITLDPGATFLGSPDEPPVITASPANLRFVQILKTDPSTYPGPNDLIERGGTALLRHLHGWVGWVVLILSIWLVPKLSHGMDALVRWLWRRVKRNSDEDKHQQRPQESRRRIRSLRPRRRSTPPPRKRQAP